MFECKVDVYIEQKQIHMNYDVVNHPSHNRHLLPWLYKILKNVQL